MFVGYIVEHATEPDGALILDLCAAPGGKATLYSTLAGPEGIVVANEAVRSRTGALADNIRKWGIGNTIVTCNDPAHFASLGERFDILAIDAPCSGEGMFRKSSEARLQWSAAAVEMCAARQRRIVADTWPALCPGGILVYSTCTFSHAENEDNVAWIAETFDCEDAGIQIPETWGIETVQAGGISCFRFRPHRIEGEGFFAAAIRKCGQKGRRPRPKPRRALMADIQRRETGELARWTGQPEMMKFARIGDDIHGYYAATYDETKQLAEYLNTVHSGICMGQLFGGNLRPDHSLAMFHDLNRNAIPEAALSEEEALRYLSKEEIAPDAFSDGMNIVTCNGYALGWAKRIGRRINNLYPKSLAIQHKR